MTLRFTIILAAVLLAACGGNNSSNPDTAQKRESKVLLPSVKQDAATYSNTVQALYVAYFGRPADPAGLTNFSAALQAAGAPTDVAGLAQAYATNPTVKGLIDSFGSSRESQTLYGSGNSSQFVEAVFQNVVGRPPLSSGLSFWVNAIDSGSLSEGNAALAIMAGALTNTTTQGKLDAQLINNRLSLASFYTSQISAFGLTSIYVGQTAAANARTLLSNFTSTSTVSAYEPVISSALATMVGNGPIVEMFAGSTGGPGNVNGPAGTARFNLPYDVVVDSSNNLYVVDPPNRVIREVAPDGTTSTFAGAMGVSGSVDGSATQARFNFPTSLTIDQQGNLYVVDNQTVRKITPGGQVTTIAGQPGISGTTNGPASSASFSNMSGIAVDSAGNIYVADNCTIRLITPQGQVSTYAGSFGNDNIADGTGSAAGFNHPGNMTVDAKGNLYLVETNAPMVRKVAPGGVVTTIAGSPTSFGSADGNGAAAQFSGLTGVALDSAGNAYVTDFAFNDVRKIDTQGNVTHYAGGSNLTNGYVDGAGTKARFNSPFGLCVDAAGNVYVADTYNNVIRKIDTQQNVSTYAGQSAYAADLDGTGTAAQFSSPAGMAFDTSGNLYVADVTGPTVRKITPGGVVTTYAGQSGVTGTPGLTSGPNALNAPGGVATDGIGNVYIADAGANQIWKINASGTANIVYGNYPYSGVQLGDPQILTEPQTMAVDHHGNVFFVDTLHYHIYQASEGGAAIYAGAHYSDMGPVDGPLATATFILPDAIAFDAADNLYVIDGSAIRKIDTSGNVTTVAGSAGNYGYQDGNASTALFTFPTSLAFDGKGNIYVADYGNNAIRKISPAGTVSTIVGQVGVVGFQTGMAPAEMAHPRGLAINGNTLYVSMEKGVVAVYNLGQ